MLSLISVDNFVVPQEVAEIIIFLLKDAAPMVIVQTMPVYDGFMGVRRASHSCHIKINFRIFRCIRVIRELPQSST